MQKTGMVSRLQLWEILQLKNNLKSDIEQRSTGLLLYRTHNNGSCIQEHRPAFYLSSFTPIKVLKGTTQSGREASLSRKMLVVLQFTCSVALIIGTVIVYQQIQYVKNRPTGYNIDRLMSTDMNENSI